LLVPEPAVVHDATDRWHRIRRNLDEVETPLLGHRERLTQRDDAELTATLVDETDVACSDTIVDAKTISDLSTPRD
jgi:hypothetical protein